VLHVHETIARRRSSLVIVPGYSAYYDALNGVVGNPNVTAWNDQSANALNLTGNNSPQYDGAQISLNGAPNNRYLSRASAISSYLTASAWTYYWAGRINSVSTNNASVFYNNDCLWTDTLNSYAGVFARSAGFISAYHWDTTQKKAEAPITLGVFVIVTAWYDGTNLNIRVNNGTTYSGPAGNIGNLSGTMLMGKQASLYSNADYRAEAFYKAAHNSTLQTQNYNFLKARHSIP
jgi:hypothetical protein